MNFYKINNFCMHFIARKRFHHDRIQNYLSKIIGKECDLSKWYHTKDKPTESETTFNMTFILGPKGEGKIKVSKQIKKPHTSLQYVAHSCRNKTQS